jgi:hypothetical protein
MSEWRRHAIYFAPEPGPLARFGAAWLGWDAEAGVEPEAPWPLPEMLEARRPALTAEPRRYGFHATLKAPFRLARGVEVDALDAAAERLAGEMRGFTLPLRVAEVGRFVALVPDSDDPFGPEADLAAFCVVRLDRFRAPLNERERERRHVQGLDEEAEAYLILYGYPWVLDRFRFHMTLTGPLDSGEREAVQAALAGLLAPLLAAPVRVGAICRFSEDAAGRFRLVRRFPFAG